MIVGESSYVSILRSYFLCIHFVMFLWEWDEWPSPRGSESLSFPSLHSLLMWLTPCLIWVDHHFSSYIHCFAIILVIAYDSSHSLHSLVLFLHRSIPGLIFPLHHSCISHYQFDLPPCLIIDIIFTLGTLKSMAHEFFYTCCILYMRTWVFFIIGYLGLLFLHFYYLITLAYITSCILRPS